MQHHTRTSGSRTYTDRARAESFGGVAEEYDRYRPSYPDGLIQDLVGLAPRRTLDVACGTGKVSVPLVACGLAVLGVDVDPKMADVARRHGILVEVAGFEAWEDEGRTFDLITCGQAWHWIDPEEGPRKAARLLTPGGTLALFWNYPQLDEATTAALDEVYARLAPDLDRTSGQERDREHAGALRRSRGFAEVETRGYRWERTLTTEEWVGRTATHSDHLRLPEESRARVLAAVRDVIDQRGGVVNAHFTTNAILARTAA